MLGKIEGKRRRGRQRINGWMAYRCNGHEFEQSSGVCDRQGSLVCLCPWGHKELDTTEQLNWTKLQQQRIQTLFFFSFFFFFLSPGCCFWVPQSCPQFKSILRHSAFFLVQLSHPHMTTGKTIALTIWNCFSKVMTLIFNMLSKIFIAFLPRSKCLLISKLQSPSALFWRPKK